jgi:hypothetical protein
MWVRRPNGKTGFVNVVGKEVIAPRFKKVADFSEGLAAVQFGKYWGVIDKKGEWAVKPIYDEIGQYKRGRAYARLREKSGFIDKHGRVIRKFKSNPLMEF